MEAALNKVSAQILDNHLNSWVITFIQEDDPDRCQTVLKEVMEVVEAF